MRSFLPILFFFVPFYLFSIDPEEALKFLKEGNARFAQDELTHPNRTSVRREKVVKGQNPFAVVLGCSDSRVPTEVLFDQGIGDLFIVRVAGNVVGPIELDSIEYGVKYLGASLVVVLGHESCGAVKAVLQGETQDIKAVARLLEAVFDKEHPKDLQAAVKENVIATVAYLKKVPLLKKAIEKGTIQIVGGYYHLSSGKVEWLSPR